MKHIRWAAVLLWTVVPLAGGCAPFFTVTHEQPQRPSFKPYRHLYVGWVAFPEQDWQAHGYATKEEWVGQIRAFNTTGLQAYVKEWMPDVQVSGAKAEDSGLPTGAELYIKFAYHGLADRGSAMGGHLEELSLGVEFIDLAARETVYRAELVVTSKGLHRRGWMQHSFDGRIDNTMYNLANWIKERLRG